MTEQPRNLIEQKAQAIRGIWAGLLNRPDITDDADFYELGGDSIAALNLMFQVSALVGADLSPAILFENPTLGGFTAAALSAPRPTSENMEEGVI